MSVPTVTKPTRRKRWLTVRLLMVAIVLLSLPIAWATNRARAQRRGVEAIRNLGGEVFYDYEFDSLGDPLSGPTKPWGPEWLHRLLGVEYFQEVHHVWFSPRSHHFVMDLDLVVLHDLPELRSLALPATEITNAGLAQVATLEHLESLQLENTQIGDEGLQHLKDLSNLTHLIIGETRVTEAGLGTITRFKALRDLRMRSLNITDDGLRRLSGMSQLEVLDLRGTPITDQGIRNPKKLTRLKWLFISGTAVTERGQAELKAALPGLFVDTLGPR
ncbi:MAG TPA: hypothetical protein VGZ22_28000 [Isosphaeraceae bacterium]|jgi:hypothetical protein|nr:hypothetical protein [Isosphaeraceae bacterium]